MSLIRIFFRWEPAPILVCVDLEDLTEDLDYVSKMYEYGYLAAAQGL